jgi:hypothetical protein
MYIHMYRLKRPLQELLAGTTTAHGAPRSGPRDGKVTTRAASFLTERAILVRLLLAALSSDREFGAIGSYNRAWNNKRSMTTQ